MQTHKRPSNTAGFALIITLSLMILLVVIAVGLLSLSSVSLRASGQASAAAVARENARLGMMLALGELQKSMGPDTSVSADSSAIIAGPARPHIMGTWQRPSDPANWSAWHWTPALTGAPNYTGKADAGLFKGWLISTANVKDAQGADLPKTAAGNADHVGLVGDPLNELKNNSISNLVVAQKVKIGPSGKLGNYAWGAFDESVKAPISLEEPITPDVGQEIAGRFAPARVRGDILVDALAGALKEPKNLISFDTTNIAAGGTKSNRDELQRRFHDFTTDSFGILTDTSRGGPKYDLTSVFESGGKGLSSTAGTGPYPPAFGADAGAPTWAFFQDLYKKYSHIQKLDAGPTYAVRDSDLVNVTSGLQAAPDSQRMLPVLAKLQVAFSIVSHREHIGHRVNFYNQHGGPGGNDNYAVVHLVYDPIVTLYNPYDVALDLKHLRIRIWDPPVGFKFTKILGPATTGELFRPTPPTSTDSANAGFYSLARFQQKWEGNSSARKAITMILSDGTNDQAAEQLRLLPGEVKVFSPRVDSDWNWAKETADEGNPYAFFDWRSESNFGNIDHRTGNQMGIEAVPGWSGRAGLSGDHLSFGGRPNSTKYPFEISSPGAGDVIGAYVPIKLQDLTNPGAPGVGDSVQVEVKVMHARERVKGMKSFQVDILAGRDAGNVDSDAINSDSNNSGVANDRLRSYSFTFAGDPPNPQPDILAPGTTSIIKRKYSAEELLQGLNEAGTGGKKTVAMLEMSARTTKDNTTDSKPWLYNNPVVEGADQNATLVGLANQSYDLRLYQMNGGFKNFPDGVEIDPDTFRGFFGASSSKGEGGSSFAPMVHVPVSPMASIGELVHSSPITSSNLPRVMHPFGNSRAHPLIPSDKVFNTAGTTMVDHSYVLNDSLWDKYYFSSITGYGQSAGSQFITQDRDRRTVLANLIDGTAPALNGRIAPILGSGEPDSLAAEIDGTAPEVLPRKISKYFGISGPFNLNSTSVDAWRSVLSSLRDRQINAVRITGTSMSATVHGMNNEVPFTRMSKPLGGKIPNAVDSSDNARWAGFRSLTDGQITSLATEIVKQIQARGQADKAPVFSVGEFVNRRIAASGGLHTLAGLLQTAINDSKINEAYQTVDGKAVTASSATTIRKVGTVNTQALTGFTSEGTPSMITQGDLMSALAPIATVRGDTFKIRSYGEAVDGTGTKVLARAWCEAVVQRVPDYVNPVDAADTEIPDATTSPLAKENQAFGRRFNIVSFRWLSEKEI